VGETKPETVLEIGTNNDGSFYIWTRYFSTVNTAISVDLPGGRFGGGYSQREAELFDTFTTDVGTHFIRANSHESDTLDTVSGVAPTDVDFLFIDGDHTYEGVKADFRYFPTEIDESVLSLRNRGYSAL
jgi:hypothetical protein